jgi:hypothetical protein
MKDEPAWIPTAKSASIRKWAGQLHTEARRLFRKDQTHANILFSFHEEKGLISVNPIAPKTEARQLNAAIVNAIDEHSLYGVILVGEAWAYFPKEKDHTAAQLLDGEMKVSELNDKDKSEALFVRMENLDGDCVVYLNEIIRDETQATLGKGKTSSGEQRNWFL